MDALLQMVGMSSPAFRGLAELAELNGTLRVLSMGMRPWNSWYAGPRGKSDEWGCSYFVVSPGDLWLTVAPLPSKIGLYCMLAQTCKGVEYSTHAEVTPQDWLQ